MTSFGKTAAHFLQLLVELHRRHPKARRIDVVLDNYVIHKARKVQHGSRHESPRTA